MKPIAKMTFDEWKDYKRKTQAERAIQDEAIPAVYDAINKHCFGGALKQRLFFMTADEADKEPHTRAVYFYGVIKIRKSFYEEHGIDDAFINLMFHEMVHAYCHKMGIEDADGDNHLEAFADACAAHGGICEWNNEKDGYNIVFLKENILDKIKGEL